MLTIRQAHGKPHKSLMKFKYGVHLVGSVNHRKPSIELTLVSF